MTNHTISANTLFHFTKSIENLRNILTHTFSPRYCLESSVDFPENESDIGVPMVCFCDIPLSQIKDHVDTYGDYAIGLSKDWAISLGISPIFYTYMDSYTFKMLQKLFESTLSLDLINFSNSVNQTQTATSNLIQLFYYCKNYKGNMWRDGELKRDITFYNEREWRFVPKLSDIESLGAPIVINRKDFNERVKDELNRKIESIKIRFSPKDIKYIIVKKESERLEMANMIEGIKLGTYSVDEIRVLNSKILSIEQIREDF